jgi:glycine betaine transporter
MQADPQQLVNSFREQTDTTVTGLTLGILVLFVLLRAAFPNWMRQTFLPDLREGMLDTFGPLFLILMVLFVLFAVAVVVGPWGSIRLGGPDASPTYSYPAYFAMFFSAGIAAGIVFWGPTEALFHYSSSAPFVGASGGTSAAASGAMQTVFFHWGISAWSAYVAVGVPIAYYAYNRGAPLRVSSLLMPFIGKENLDHPAAKLVDVLAVFATIGGVGTSVGLVGGQFLSGVAFQWGVETSAVDTLIVVGGITLIFTVSVITGVKRGIRRIAGVNLVLFVLMGALTLVLGPTEYILTNGATAFVDYLVGFVGMSFAGITPGGSADWYNGWTLFYWVWWFSWAPFAGLFLASISRGRTLRTVTLTGVFASGFATLAWFAIVSNASLWAQTTGTVDILGLGGEFVLRDVAGFALYSSLPLGELLVFLFLSLIITWIVTSADTSTLVVSIHAVRPGVVPETATRAFWGLLQGAMAFGLIVVGGANALQTAAVVTGGPIGLIALVGVLGLFWQFGTGESWVGTGETDVGAEEPEPE